MPAPLLTIGTATRDDNMVWMVINAVQTYFPHLMDRTEIIIIDNSKSTFVDGEEQLNRYANDLEQHLKDAKGIRYIRAAGPPSSCIYKDMIFKHAKGKYVVCCDSHVLFVPGSLDALLKHFQENPESNDLIMGPVLNRAGNLIATQQMLYDTEIRPDLPVPGGSRVINGVVCRGGQLGAWVKDHRGMNPANPPYEIMQNGTGAFACRREAWPGFNPNFKGFGGNETYLMEKFRKRGDKVLCLPAFCWIHCWYDPDGKPYTPLLADKVRNYLTGFRELGLSNLYKVVIDFFRKDGPKTVDNVVAEVEKRATKTEASGGKKKEMEIAHAKAIELLQSSVGGAACLPLFGMLSTYKPNARTLEFGSGISTLALDGRVADHTAIEHDPKWAERIKPHLKNPNTKIITAPLVGSTPWYDWTSPPGVYYDLILIDGPPGNAATDPGRLGAIGNVEHLLAPDGILIIDDTQREPEKKLADHFVKSLEMKAHRFEHGMRTFHILVPDDTSPLGEGPGTVMKEQMAEKGFPACKQCINLARKMNKWGPDGCREQMDYIVTDILPRAKGWLHGSFPWAQKYFGFFTKKVEEPILRLEITRLVNLAITTYEERATNGVSVQSEG